MGTRTRLMVGSLGVWDSTHDNTPYQRAYRDKTLLGRVCFIIPVPVVVCFGNSGKNSSLKESMLDYFVGLHILRFEIVWGGK